MIPGMKTCKSMLAKRNAYTLSESQIVHGKLYVIKTTKIVWELQVATQASAAVKKKNYRLIKFDYEYSKEKKQHVFTWRVGINATG